MRIVKPFVYFSESVLTPSKSVDLLERALKESDGSCLVDLNLLWKGAALSVRSQAALHRMTGYKGKKYHKWLTGVLDNVADGIEFPSQAAKAGFKSILLPSIGKPQNYYVPDSVRRFLNILKKNEIGCGVIANESHLYPAILKFLDLGSVSPMILSSGPTMFKPLPRMWQRAVEKAPAAGKHDIWFIGSCESPCDNMRQNHNISCALVKHDLAISDPLSRHCRIKQLDDLLPALVEGQEAAPFLAQLDHVAGDAQSEELAEDDDVEMSTHLPGKMPPLEGKEVSIADTIRKHSS